MFYSVLSTRLGRSPSRLGKGSVSILEDTSLAASFIVKGGLSSMSLLSLFEEVDNFLFLIISNTRISSLSGASFAILIDYDSFFTFFFDSCSFDGDSSFYGPEEPVVLV